MPTLPKIKRNWHASKSDPDFQTGQTSRFDPLPIRNHRPYSLLTLRAEPWNLHITPEKRQTWRFGFTAANSLTVTPIRNPILLEDIEADRLTLDWEYGLGHNQAVTAQVAAVDLGPGFMDPLIDWYHRTFLHLDNIRSDIPYGGHIVASPAGPSNGGGIGLGDTVIGFRKDFSHNLSTKALIKIPTGNPAILTGSGRPDAGIAAQYWRPLNSRWRLIGNAAVFATSSAIGLKGTNNVGWQWGFNLIYSPNPKDSWILNFDCESSALRLGVPNSDGPHPLTSFAYRRQTSSHNSLEAFFSEDVNVFSPNLPVGAEVGPDFTIGLIYRIF